MFTKTKIALAAALLFAATSAVLANDIDESASAAQVERDWQDYLNSIRTGHPANAYGYFASPSQEDLSRSQRQSHSR